MPLGTGFRIVAADRMRAMVMEKIENEYKHAFEGLETEEGMVIRPLEQLKWLAYGPSPSRRLFFEDLFGSTAVSTTTASN